MEKIKLTQLNSTFRLHGSEKRRSLEIIKVISEDQAEHVLQLQVQDEKDIPIYAQDLNLGPGNQEVPVNKKFVFYHHISVSICLLSPGPPFEVEILYV